MIWRRPASHLSWMVLAAALVSGCATGRLNLPADVGRPLANFSDIHASLTSACAGVRTFTAELGLSGRVGSERVRGRVLAGFMRPDAMRLEGVAPLGPPAFILVSSAGASMLLLPRDGAVVRDAPPAEVLEALTGVALEPADLQAVLTGCVVANGRAVGGQIHQNGWASIALEAGSTLYLQREGGMWRLRAARRGQWTIEYPTWQGQFPAGVRLRSDAATVPVDIAASIGQLEANVTLEPSTFSVVVPPGTMELSVGELRRSGPLRGQP